MRPVDVPPIITPLTAHGHDHHDHHDGEDKIKVTTGDPASAPAPLGVNQENDQIALSQAAEGAVADDDSDHDDDDGGQFTANSGPSAAAGPGGPVAAGQPAATPAPSYQQLGVAVEYSSFTQLIATVTSDPPVQGGAPAAAPATPPVTPTPTPPATAAPTAATPAPALPDPSPTTPAATPATTNVAVATTTTTSIVELINQITINNSEIDNLVVQVNFPA